MTTILVINDDSEFYKLVEFILTRNGYTVWQAPDGEFALELLETQHPDFIFMDSVIPRMGGTEVVKRIRQNPRTQGIPVVFYCIQAERKELFLQAGADDLLIYPARPQEILDKVRKFIP
jgi:CheY-like chemotaxis protein